jgi:hypothetical protein
MINPALGNTPSDQPQTVQLDAGSGDTQVHLKANVTPSGLLAAGGLVAGILFATTALVWAATSVRRKHPIASALRKL